MARIFADVRPHLGAKMEPKTILEPRSAQDPQTCSQDGPRTSNLQPRWHQIAPGRLHGPIFIIFWTSLGQILDRFWRILQPSWLDFGIDFAPIFAYTPVCRSSHRSPMLRGGGDSPQAFSITKHLDCHKLLNLDRPNPCERCISR